MILSPLFNQHRHNLDPGDMVDVGPPGDGFFLDPRIGDARFVLLSFFRMFIHASVRQRFAQPISCYLLQTLEVTG